MDLDDYIKPKKRVRQVAELTDEEVEFLNMVIDGSKKISASLKAFFPDSDWEDPDVKKKAKMRYVRLLNTRKAHVYIAKNGRRATVFVSADLDRIATHIADICYGEARRNVTKVLKDGEVTTYEESPSFQDQISAALFLKGYCEYKEKYRSEISAKFEERQDEINEKARKFTEQWRTRRIDEANLKTKSFTDAVLNETINNEIERMEGDG